MPSKEKAYTSMHNFNLRYPMLNYFTLNTGHTYG